MVIGFVFGTAYVYMITKVLHRHSSVIECTHRWPETDVKASDRHRDLILVSKLKVNHSQFSNPKAQTLSMAQADSVVKADGVGVCDMQKYVFYVKVHKTGSSTVNNMLYRWGLRHNLRMLPVKYAPYPSRKLTNVTQRFPNGSLQLPYQQFNYFAEHVMFDEEKVRKVVHASTRYIGSVRFPIDQIRDWFVEKDYLGSLLGLIKKTPPGGDIMETYMGKIINGNTPRNDHQKNFMCKIFGFRNSMKLDDVTLQRFIDKLSSLFSVVLVQEYMDESLILLKRKLCWTMQDILYVPQRMRTFEHKHRVLPWRLEQAHRNYSSCDYRLHDHFAKKLFVEITQEANFMDELLKYRKLKENMQSFCKAIYAKLYRRPKSIYEIAVNRDHVLLDPSPFGTPFNITSMDCVFMLTTTIVFRNLLLSRQMPWLCDLVPRPKMVAGPLGYCRERHPKYGFSLHALSFKGAYMDLEKYI